MTLIRDNCIAILRAALTVEVGLQILVTTPQPLVAKTLRAKQNLYRFAKEDAEFQFQIKLMPSDPDNRVWILRNNILIPE